MSVPEPALRTAPGKTGHYHGRWRWWYAAICDFRLANPGCTNAEIAAHVGKNPNTVSAITNTDLYREYEAQRLAAWRAQHDTVLRQKLTGVAIKALDALDVQLEKKRDQVPLEIAREIVTSSLDRLGFAPKQAPQVVVNNNSSQQVVMPASVSAHALEEARMALRAVEASRIRLPGQRPAGRQLELEAEPSLLSCAQPSEVAEAQGEDLAGDSTSTDS